MGLPDNRLDSIDKLDLIKSIEVNVNDLQPELIYVHHSGDLNIDHQLIHEAVITACRPLPGKNLKTILTYEVASSTEWRTSGSGSSFIPNWFVNIENQLSRKLKSLEIYNSEMRSWPHPRSIKAIEYQARLRGAQVGKEAAEAFSLMRNIL